MTEQDRGTGPRPGETDPFPGRRQGWLERRREKVVQEVLRNRRGEYTVPTWVLGALLAVIVAVWITLIVLS